MQTALRPILLAEDNPADVELTLSALRAIRIANEIVVVGDGAEALDFLHRRGAFGGRITPQPAVVLLDLKMPRVDGLEVLRQIRSTPELRHVPAVIFTSSREERDIVRSYELGTNAYMVKPVDFQEFITAIGGLGIFWALLNEPVPDSR
ncbi:MAG: two-component system response regulator [Opitutus sp.]|nr:two-component system response regulator [Opitutus sp.]